MSENGELDGELRSCIVCYSQIPKKAEKCIHCNEYQNKRKRNVLYIAQIANSVAILAFVATFLAFSGNLLSDFVNRLFPEASIEFFSYDSAQLNIANTGDGAIFVDSISFKRAFPKGKKDFSTQDYRFLAIKKVVEEGQFLTHKFQPGQPFILETVSTLFGQAHADGSALYELTVEAILKNRTRDEFGKACAYMPFLSSEDYSYLNTDAAVKQSGFKEGVFKIWYVSQIRYYSRAQKAWRIHPFMAVSIPTLSADEKCANFKQAIQLLNQVEAEKSTTVE